MQNKDYLGVLLVTGEAAAEDGDGIVHCEDLLLQHSQGSVILCQQQQVTGLTAINRLN